MQACLIFREDSRVGSIGASSILTPCIININYLQNNFLQHNIINTKFLRRPRPNPPPPPSHPPSLPHWQYCKTVASETTWEGWYFEIVGYDSHVGRMAKLWNCGFGWSCRKNRFSLISSTLSFKNWIVKILEKTKFYNLNCGREGWATNNNIPKRTGDAFRPRKIRIKRAWKGIYE